MAYKFNSRFCIIGIEDMKFRVNFGKGLIDELNNARDIAALTKDRGVTADENTVICNDIDKVIDGILGKGSADKIFSGRDTDYVERLDVLAYILSEITAFMNRIAGEANVSPEGKNH